MSDLSKIIQREGLDPRLDLKLGRLLAALPEDGTLSDTKRVLEKADFFKLIEKGSACPDLK